MFHKDWCRLLRARSVRALCSVALFGALAAHGQAVEEDPLPPLPPLDPNQEPPLDWAAWLGVPKLLGISQADIASAWAFTSDTTRQRRSGQSHTTVFMELEVPGPDESVPGSSAEWKVTSASAFGSIHSTYSSYTLGAGQWLGGEGVTQGSYTGPLSLRVEPYLRFRLVDGTGQFSTLSEPTAAWGAEFNGSVTELNPVGGGVVVRQVGEIQTQDPFRAPLEHSPVSFTAPKSAVPFSGFLALEGPSGDGSGRGEGSFRRTASVQFWPDWNDLEVRVEIEDATNPGTRYTSWRPEGNLQEPDQGGPRPLRLKATLRPKAESPTPEQLAAMPPVRRFRFELSDVSREPGVCMNWPVPKGTNTPPDDPEYDLRFIATVPEAMELSPKKTKAGVRPLPGDDPNLPSAWILLECFDFGAHANVQVYADLADGRVITGHLRDGETKQYLIPIPDRPLGSLVARKWRDDNGVTGPDSDDVDAEPEGDGQKGDGFSVYEEYRGFRVNEAHVAPDPRIKNLFVRNKNASPTAAACRSIEKMTAVGGKNGLRIYDELLSEEWHPSRIINPNRSASSPRSSDEPQHGILVQTNASASAGVIYSYADKIDDDGPKRPKNYDSVLVHPADLDVMTVAHEITHAIGVHHHGDLDFEAKWFVREVRGPNGTAARRFFEQIYGVNVTTGALTPIGNPFPIAVFEEGSSVQKLPDQSTNAPIPEPTSEYIARSGGQHSGDVTCYMRYDAATAYMPPGRLTVRIVPNSTNDVAALARNSALCRSCNGTGPNPKRHGHATTGNCVGQVCVRDSAPERPPPTGQCPANAPSPSLQGMEPVRSWLAQSAQAPSLQAGDPAPASTGLVVFDGPAQGFLPQATRGWPLHFVWHALDPGTPAPSLSLVTAGGAALTVNAVEPGHWWISPEQSRDLPAGSATVRVGSSVLNLQIIDPPANPSAPEQEAARRLALIGYLLASSQPLAAQREAEAWIAAVPEAPTPRALLGDALAAQGRLTEALAEYTACLSRIQQSEHPPKAVLQRYRKVRGAWLAQLPEAPADYFDAAPEPATLEEQDRVYGQDTRGQWAASATASSEYRTSGDYSASRATGAPDVTRYGDSLAAWASRLADSGPEWLELSYTQAVVASAVRVRQVFNPGAIDRIEVFDAAGRGTTVYSGADTNRYASGQIAWFVVNFPATDQPVKRVRISLDSARVKGWNEIDAVQLVAAPALPTPPPKLAYVYRAATSSLEIPAWPTGFVLQRATRLAPADWQDHATVGPITLPAGGNAAYFRLVQAP